MSNYQDGANYYAFLYDAIAGTFTPISFPGSISNWAYGINNNSQIVGTYLDSASGVHGYLLSNGNYTSLDYPGATSTWAYGINDAAQIVGTYCNGSCNQNGTHAFLATHQ